MGMTERPDGSGPATPPGAAGEPAEQPARRPSPSPSPSPSPTSRARRAAAAGVETRRPSPRPAAAPRPAAPADPGSANGTGPDAATPASVTAAPRTTLASEEDSAAGATRGRRAPLWLAVLLAVLVLAGVAALIVVLRLPSGAGSAGDRDRALSAAKTEVPLILSYNYQNFDADVAKAKAELTGRAVTDYTTAMAKTIKPTAIKVKAVVQAQTDGAGVESVAPDGRQVTVVVFGEQKVTNSSLAAPRTDLFRVRATLDLVGDRWLVSKFDQI